MKKRNFLIAGIILAGLVTVYLPGFSRIMQLKEENGALRQEIERLKSSNAEMEEAIERLETDPVYLEDVARDKFKKTRRGEIIYRVN